MRTFVGRYLTVPLVMVLWVCFGTAKAQSKTPATPVYAGASKDEIAVRKVLSDQAAAWNKGSIDGFMKGYWKNDSLLFVSKSGLSYGYTTALNNYKKSYGDRAKMGILFFTLAQLTRLSPTYYFVTGRWLIKRSGGDIGGCYTLLFRKIGGAWVIVNDHTS